MSDVKVSALTEASAVSSDDLLMIVDDPSGTPTSKKITITNFLTGGGTLAVGQIFYWNGSKLAALAAGTDGYYLKAKGAAAPNAHHPITGCIPSATRKMG